MADKKDDFLEENVEEEEQQETEVETEGETEEEKIKVGDDEYTREELKGLVTLGKIGKEAEEKYDTKIDRVWPEFTKSRQELKELKEEAAKKAEERTKAKMQAGETLSSEEQKRIAQEEARKLDLVLTPDLEKKIDERYARLRAAERITEDAEDTVLEAQKKYGIKTNVKELLEHMAETGIRNPEKALKDKFEPQIDKWKEEQLAKKKGVGLVTETSSTAGAKKPTMPKITRDNLRSSISEALKEG